jgi:hypothetical protein
MSPFVHRNVNPTAPTLAVEPWPDPVVEAMGHDPRSAYANEYWLPLVGPSVMAVARKLVEQIEAAGGPTTVEVIELAGSVGLGCTVGPEGLARNSRIVATLGRLCQFGLAHTHANPDGTALLRVRTAWAPLTRRQAERLPAHLLARLDAA